MRLVSIVEDGAAAAGVLVDEEVLPTAALGAPGRRAGAARRARRETGCGSSASAPRAPARRASRSPRCTLAAPVPDPEKIICLGLNYRDHAEETGQEIPQAPMWFAKFRNSLCGSGADIVLPAAHPDFVDYEAELALVIGRAARNVAAEATRSRTSPA